VETTEAPAPERRGRLPRIFAVVVLLAVGVFALVRFEVIGGPSPQERDAAVRSALVQRMTTELEKLPASGHAGHGGTDTQGRTVCGARVYGYEPKDAKTADDVTTLYGFHLCAVAEPEGAWDWAPKFVAPLVMKLDTTPPAMEMAAATEKVSYRERVTQLIPAEYRELAFQGALEPHAMAELRRKFDEAVAAT
jgi:hypothetical protein